jgi:hypothetical protein
MMSLISMVTRILKSKAWIGMTWKEKQLRMIARRRGMAMKLLIPGPRENLGVRPKMIWPRFLYLCRCLCERKRGGFILHHLISHGTHIKESAIAEI